MHEYNNGIAHFKNVSTAMCSAFVVFCMTSIPPRCSSKHVCCSYCYRNAPVISANYLMCEWTWSNYSLRKWFVVWFVKQSHCGFHCCLQVGGLVYIVLIVCPHSLHFTQLQVSSYSLACVILLNCKRHLSHLHVSSFPFKIDHDNMTSPFVEGKILYNSEQNTQLPKCIYNST